MEKVQFGVIGAGFMGDLHAGIGYHLPHAEFICAADPDQKRVSTLAQKYEGKAYANYTEMLDKEDLDAVVICTPETLHVDPVLKAAERGVHIMLEKPLARTMEEADTIIETCEKEQVKLMIGYILRFEPTHVKLKEALEAGTFGPFLSAYARRNTPIQEARRLGGRTTVTNYIAVHDIDLILWYHPQKVVKVFGKALQGKVQRELGTWDYSWGLFEFEDGALGIVETGWGYPEKWLDWNRPPTWGGFGDACMNVVCEEGVANINFLPMDMYAIDAENWKLAETRHWPQMYGRTAGALKLELEHFFECVLYDQEPMISGQDGRRSLEVACAIEQSIAEGREIELPLVKSLEKAPIM